MQEEQHQAQSDDYQREPEPQKDREKEPFHRAPDFAGEA
jgi:hypothetical protein